MNSDRFILRLIDDYEIFCYYYGEEIEIGTAVSSPFRDDKKPSFSLFAPTDPDEEFYELGYSLLFKDFAYNVCGDVFAFVAKLFKLNRQQAIDKVAYDLLNGEVVIRTDIEVNQKNRKRTHGSKDIRIVSTAWTQRAIDYWLQYGITTDMLEKHRVSQVSVYYIDSRQFYAKDITFAYELCGKYQIYQPFGDKYRFVNNFTYEMFFGYLNLPPKGDRLIIDKSKKDVIFCYEVLGIPAIAPKGEGIMIVEAAMLALKERFPIMYLMLDNDAAGHKCAVKWLKTYPWLKPVFLPLHKDKTDCAKAIGPEDAKIHILKVIQESDIFKTIKI